MPRSTAAAQHTYLCLPMWSKCNPSSAFRVKWLEEVYQMVLWIAVRAEVVSKQPKTLENPRGHKIISIYFLVLCPQKTGWLFLYPKNLEGLCLQNGKLQSGQPEISMSCLESTVLLRHGGACWRHTLARSKSRMQCLSWAIWSAHKRKSCPQQENALKEFFRYLEKVLY